MGIKKITERQVIGWFYMALAAAVGLGWINEVSNFFTSDQESEEYAWLGMSPVLREWLGGRQAKGFNENSIKIVNKHFEATEKFLVKDMRRDKTGQIKARIMEMAKRTNTHWASLLSTLILNGAAGVCYDGQYFFDTDHSEGESGTQSNDISVDISGLPVSVHGSVGYPSVPEMQLAIVQGITQIVGFKDDQGEPMNEDASKFLVKVPLSLMNVAKQAVATPMQVSESQTVLEALKQDFSITVAANPRLSSWTDQFAVFRTDSYIKSFICQEETKVMLKVKGAGSTYEFDNDAHQYGVDTWRNVGYGYWQNACLVKMV